MPCQVSGQAVATNSWKLAQAPGVGGAAGAGSAVGRSAAGSARATPAIALMTTKARTDLFTLCFSLPTATAIETRYIPSYIAQVVKHTARLGGASREPVTVAAFQVWR